MSCFSPRYGFVQFSNEQDAKVSHDKMQDHKLKGITLIVLFAKKWTRDEKTKEKQQKLGEACLFLILLNSSPSPYLALKNVTLSWSDSFRIKMNERDQ